MAVKFNGDSYIVLPPILSGKSTFSINMLLATGDTQANNAAGWNIAHFIGFELNGYDSYDFAVGVNGGYLEEHDGISNNERTTTLRTNYTINDNKSHRVTAIYDSTKVTLYADSVLVGTWLRDRADAVTNENIYIATGGIQGDGSIRTKMTLYDCQIYDGAITVNDIEKNIDGTESNLLAWYTCNDAKTFKDKSKNSYDGTIVGSLELDNLFPGCVQFDLSRKLSNRDTGTFDLLRIVTDKQMVAETFDLSRKVTKSVSDRFDLKRTVLSSTIHCTLDCDLERDVCRTVSASYDLERIIPADSGFRFDLRRTVYVKKNIGVDLERLVCRTVSDHYDTKRILPYSLDDMRIQSVTLSLQENTLTDHMSFAIAGELHPFDVMRGIFLDYPYQFTIESTHQQELIQTCNSMYDFDDILTRYYKYSIESEHALAGIYASMHAEKIAAALGLVPVCRFDDFEPENNYNLIDVTYSNLISSIFGWTTRLPRRQINIFMRGNKLYFLQRGNEPNTIDITNIPHSRPTIQREIVRAIDRINIPPQGIGMQAWTKFYVDPKFFGKSLSASDGDKDYSDGKIQSSGGAGVGTQTTTNPDGSTMTIDYEYDSKNRVIKKNVTNPDDSSVKIEYEYSDTSGGSFLVKQTEIKTDKNGKSETTVTRYDPVGNGYVSASQADEDGNYVGGSLSKGGGNGDVDKTEMQSVQTALGAGWNDGGDDDAAGNKTEIGWPVTDRDTMERILSEICWIYHSIKEQVTVDIQCRVTDRVPEYTHIIDFTDKIVLDGNTYYLQSNTVRRDSRSLTQSLQLVRWYGGGTVSDKSDFVVNKTYSGV